MIKAYKTGKIIKDGRYILKNINGEILKIVVFCKKEINNVSVKITSIDGETIIHDHLNSKKTRFYPKNMMTLSEEQKHVENYFVAGNMTMDISGVGDAEEIDMIVIYYI